MTICPEYVIFDTRSSQRVQQIADVLDMERERA